MSTQAHTLRKNTKARKTRTRLGRGNASSGNFSGRGMKGQRARSGGKSGNARRAFMHNLRNIPKHRGFKSVKGSAKTVTLTMIEDNFAAGDIVAPHTLLKKQLIATIKSGVKIVFKGELTKAVTVKGCKVSANAKEQIEKVGGKVNA